MQWPHKKKSTTNPCSQSLCVCFFSFQGDSGGPVQINHSTVSCMYTILGVTSFGKICGTEGVPGKSSELSKIKS